MLIPDHETEVDYLNCEVISQTVVELLKTSRDRPLTVGVHGDWGAGKSSVLKMIEAEFSTDESVAVLWFNGWMFEGFDDAKTVMIESIVTELLKQHSKIDGVKEKAKSLLQRVNWLKFFRRSSGVAFNLLTGLPAPDQIQIALGALGKLGRNVIDSDGTEIHAELNEIAGILKPKEEENNVPNTIHAFRGEFKALLDEAQIKQLVVLIDDLDRCLPTTAVETLEAIRLFLFVPKSAFVIGADEVMIEYSVKQHFPDLPVASGPLPYARNYLEKLIHVPFRIPALGVQETRTYVTLLLVQSIVGENDSGFDKLLSRAKDSLLRPWEGIGLTQEDVLSVDVQATSKLKEVYILAQQIAPILAEGTKGNPRQIKRFLNALLLRLAVAKARGFGSQFKQPVLAKLMLAERFQPDFFEHVCMDAMRADSGKSSDIAMLESTNLVETSPRKEKTKTQDKETGKRRTKGSAEEVHKWLERPWLEGWLRLEPKLANEDLRPYVFVARDKRVKVNAVAQDDLAALITKLCGSHLVARTVEQEVKSLSTTDASIVFNALRERVLGVGSFLTAPPGIDGLGLVAKHHHLFQSELILLLESLDPKRLGPWVVKGWIEVIVDRHARSKLIELIQVWGTQDDNQVLKVAAQSAIPAYQVKSR
ncbi:MAG: P-loop NTPase fold protein [Gammaproteobacteria bacterium]|nr:P-loop NTPase fold protein [Gammaproteobacteria bacterium]